jgi:hypothetical protein
MPSERNPATPTPVLERLVADKHHLPRYGVAQNSDARSWEIALQAHDPDVRVILAQRQDLDERTLQRLLGTLITGSESPLPPAAGAPRSLPRWRATRVPACVLLQR